MHFADHTPESLERALDDCRATEWDRAAIRESALRFSTAVFSERMKDAVGQFL